MLQRRMAGVLKINDESLRNVIHSHISTGATTGALERFASTSARIERKAVKPYAIAMTEVYPFSESGLHLREYPLVCSFILRVAQITAFIYLDRRGKMLNKS